MEEDKNGCNLAYSSQVSQSGIFGNNCVWSRGEREGVEKEEKGMEEAGKNALCKRNLNLIISGLISSKIVKSKKETNEQKYQKTNRQKANPKLRIEIKVIFNRL